MPIVKCDYCGKEFNKAPCKIKKDNYHYCGDECRCLGRRKRIDLICPVCGKNFQVLLSHYQKYKSCCCSMACSGKNRENKIVVTCDYCGKDIIKKPSSILNKNFCNKKCESLSKMKEIEIFGTHAELIIKDYRYKIDLCDVEEVKKHNWNYISEKTNYARSSRSKILLHRLIMNCPDDMVVDHINHDIFDNRRSNLRIVTMKENCQNRNPINNKTRTNLTYITIDDRWATKYKVRVTVGKKRVCFGEYYTLEEAIKVRDKALKEREEKCL